MEANVRKYQEITIDIDRYKKIRPYLEGYFNDQYSEIAIFPEIKPFKNIGPAKELTLMTYLPNIETIFENDPYIRKFLDTLTPDNYDTICWVMRVITDCLRKTKGGDEYYEDNPATDPNDYYPQNLRDDLLKMYLFCEDTPEIPYQNNEISIKMNGHTAKFRNYDNYLLRCVLKDFCSKYLNIEGIYTREEVIEDLKLRHKAGRRSMNDYSPAIIYGTYKMLKTISQEETAISTAICRIIGKFLIYLKLESIDVATDEHYIRTNITRVLKKNPHPTLLRAKECTLDDPYQPLYRK